MWEDRGKEREGPSLWVILNNISALKTYLPIVSFYSLPNILYIVIYFTFILRINPFRCIVLSGCLSQQTQITIMVNQHNYSAEQSHRHTKTHTCKQNQRLSNNPLPPSQGHCLTCQKMQKQISYFCKLQLNVSHVWLIPHNSCISLYLSVPAEGHDLVSSTMNM